MLQLLYPYECAESVFAIDYEKLYAMGYRAVIFDIDNTLVYQDADSTEETDSLFRAVQKTGLKTFILSNNHEDRVLRFLKNTDSMYICEAGKPKPGGFKKALKALNVKAGEAVFIGDQIFTDVLGANLSGIANILVDFIRPPATVKIGKRRYIEKIVLKRYRKKGKYTHRLGPVIKETK